MSDAAPVNDFDVKVEQQDDGWAVVTVADGERSIVSHHPDKDAAEFAATQVKETATRHAGAIPPVPPDPEKYPGDQVD